LVPRGRTFFGWFFSIIIFIFVLYSSLLRDLCHPSLVFFFGFVLSPSVNDLEGWGLLIG
jgi:hypothetical protein